MKISVPLLFLATLVAGAAAEQPGQPAGSNAQSPAIPADRDVSQMTFGPAVTSGSDDQSGEPAAAVLKGSSATPAGPAANSPAPSVPATPTPAIPPAKPTAAADLIPQTFTRVFTWNGIPLESAVDQLINNFNCPLVLQADPAIRIRSTYSGETIESILKLMCADANLTFKQQDGIIYLTGKQDALPTTSFAAMAAAAPKMGPQPDVAAPTSPPPPLIAKGGGNPATSLAKNNHTTSNPPKNLFHLSFTTLAPMKSDPLLALAQRRAKLLAQRRQLLSDAP